MEGVNTSAHEWLVEARVGRLATASLDGRPHCIPVVFAWDGEALLVPLDDKPKKVGVRELRRVRNIESNPRAVLLVDGFSEDWSHLWYVMVECHAAIVPATDHIRILLTRKYSQYKKVGIQACIRLEPIRTVAWRGEELSR